MAHIILIFQTTKEEKQMEQKKRKLTTINYKETNIDTIIISQNSP
jgi:hypothetical protein